LKHRNQRFYQFKISSLNCGVFLLRRLFITFLLISLLTACSSKPSDVRSEVWDMANEAFTIIDNSINNNEYISDYDAKRILNFTEKYRNLNVDNVTGKEYEIANGILELMKLETTYQTQKALSNVRGMELTKSKFNEVKLEVKKLLEK